MSKTSSKNAYTSGKREAVESRTIQAVQDKDNLNDKLTPEEIDDWMVSGLQKKPRLGETREQATQRLMKMLAAFCVARINTLAVSGEIGEEKVLDAVMRAVSKHLEPPKQIELSGKVDMKHEIPDRLAEALANGRKNASSN